MDYVLKTVYHPELRKGDYKYLSSWNSFKEKFPGEYERIISLFMLETSTSLETANQLFNENWVVRKEADPLPYRTSPKIIEEDLIRTIPSSSFLSTFAIKTSMKAFNSQMRLEAEKTLKPASPSLNPSTAQHSPREKEQSWGTIFEEDGPLVRQASQNVYNWIKEEYEKDVTERRFFVNPKVFWRRPKIIAILLYAKCVNKEKTWSKTAGERDSATCIIHLSANNTSGKEVGNPTPVPAAASTQANSSCSWRETVLQSSMS